MAGTGDAVHTLAIPSPPRLPSLASLRLPSSEPLEQSSITQDLLPVGWAARARTGEGHRVVLVTAGSMRVVHPALGSVEVPAGQALLMAPGTEVAETNATDEDLRRLVLECRWDTAAAPHCEPGSPSLLVDGSGRLHELLGWLMVERSSLFDGAGEYRQLLLLLVGAECRRITTDASGALERRVRAYVLEHIRRPITLSELAAHVGLGRFHLCRKYRELTGMTPMNAVRAIRLERARELICDTGAPLKDIAREVGLRSEQHLSRLLSTHFGMGVRDIRRSARDTFLISGTSPG